MNTEINSKNPAVKAIITGDAPRPAQLAAARGILPLPQADLLEVLVALSQNSDAELAENARQSLTSQVTSNLESVVKSDEIAPSVLAFYAEQEFPSPAVHEAILTNPKTPRQAIVNFARQTKNGELLELLSFNQQLLIQNPAIIDVIVANPYRTAEAERRASEIKREFFEKERGAKQIANELRARGKEAAAEFFEKAEITENLAETPSNGNLSFEDAILLAEHIEVPDSETDDTWLSSLEYLEELYEETEEQRFAVISKIIGDFRTDNDEISAERISMINRIMRMGMKDRIKLAMKGDREARNILIRDPNRIVSQAVIQNPRITEQEIQRIAAMRSVNEDILRQIAINRKWSRLYPIMVNLVRNPRTPLTNAMTILTRLQPRDLDSLSKNKNISESVRRQAFRIAEMRKGR